MPPKGKQKTKALKSPSVSKPPSSTNLNPPKPFNRPSVKLDEFLPKLSKQHVYITHIDMKPRDFKMKIFMVPVLMNVLIILGIIWRIKLVWPFYMKICFSMMGKFNDLTIDTSNMPLEGIIYEILQRMMVFGVDLFIYVFIWPWPRDFFAGRTIDNPISWRFGVGFRNQEIIVRRSKKWDRTIVNVLDEESSGTQLMYSNIRQAVNPIMISEKTGYLMLNKEWDLDWRSMVLATRLVDKKNLDLGDFKTMILVHHAEFGWMAIETADAGGSIAEEEGRRKIVAFKDELTALGKENLFFKWIELVQFESSRPGGFGPERQQETMAKAKAMFEAQGVDFEKFWAKVGGFSGMPGMDEI
ncbi:hypothetical protein D0Z07_7160 [Hyphodiscus hymeniophilus]|uniref:Uncharacterized protein n=1 Tax=Hyphodiscus hymeniophilus TaxID=353542 RepID=A0A9P6VGJ4_9HELO|nr:hypothetical protein D0Z07_7160 [Hyphodiscus hymeniophilus]